MRAVDAARVLPRCVASNWLRRFAKSTASGTRLPYGSPRMTQELRARGVDCCENWVAKAMKYAEICAKSAKRGVGTPDSNHRLPVAENVLHRNFTATKPNAAWVADITYIPTGTGWLYLALAVDLFSRRIIGWSMDVTMTSRLVVDALALAIGRREVTPSLIVHSDRGGQCCSEHYQRELTRHGPVLSTSRRANCWDNTVARAPSVDESGTHTPSTLLHRQRSQVQPV